ncbi:hypothetical protein IMZ48_20840 [Candidatus Bathyarchaeota archaeon]|nr:hypothetical protein [Candidatus Bathyarchaeota archaeon]
MLFASYWEGKTDDDLTIMEHKDSKFICRKIYDGYSVVRDEGPEAAGT